MNNRSPSGAQQLRVVLFPESGAWVAQCIDYDLVAQGKSAPEAQANFQRTLQSHVLVSLKHGETPFANIHCAPRAKPEQKEPVPLLANTFTIAYSRLEKPELVEAW